MSRGFIFGQGGSRSVSGSGYGAAVPVPDPLLQLLVNKGILLTRLVYSSVPLQSRKRDLSREPSAEGKFNELLVRSNTGLGPEKHEPLNQAPRHRRFPLRLGNGRSRQTLPEVLSKILSNPRLGAGF